MEATPPAKPRTLGLLSLVFFAFFCVSGGPVGTESLVGASGHPFWALLGLLAAPWLFALPISLMSAELSTRMPENGGYVVWVTKALGPYWGFQEGVWSIVNVVTNQAMFPVMLTDYLKNLWSEDAGFTHPVEIAVRLLVVWLVVAANIGGLDVVDRLSSFFGLLVMSPFVILIFMSLPHVKPSMWVTNITPVTSVDWGLYLSVLMWNNAGWDNVGCVAGEVKNVSRTFPRGMIIANIIICVLYFVVIATFSCVDTDWTSWTEGTYPRSALLIGGRGMQIFVVVAACISFFGMCQVIMCTSAWMLTTMAGPDMFNIPQLAYISRFNTPWVSVLVNGMIASVMTFLPFNRLVEVMIVLYATHIIPEYLSVVYFRIYGFNKTSRRPVKAASLTAAPVFLISETSEGVVGYEVGGRIVAPSHVTSSPGGADNEGAAEDPDENLDLLHRSRSSSLGDGPQATEDDEIYTIPLNTVGLILFLLPSFAMMTFFIIKSELITKVICVGVITFGIVLRPLTTWRRSRLEGASGSGAHYASVQ